MNNIVIKNIYFMLIVTARNCLIALVKTGKIKDITCLQIRCDNDHESGKNLINIRLWIIR